MFSTQRWSVELTTLFDLILQKMTKRPDILWCIYIDWQLMDYPLIFRDSAYYALKTAHCSTMTITTVFTPHIQSHSNFKMRLLPSLLFWPPVFTVLWGTATCKHSVIYLFWSLSLRCLVRYGSTDNSAVSAIWLNTKTFQYYVPSLVWIQCNICNMWKMSIMMCGQYRWCLWDWRSGHA